MCVLVGVFFYANDTWINKIFIYWSERESSLMNFLVSKMHADLTKTNPTEACWCSFFSVFHTHTYSTIPEKKKKKIFFLWKNNWIDRFPFTGLLTDAIWINFLFILKPFCVRIFKILINSRFSGFFIFDGSPNDDDLFVFIATT